jgi:hypothetical protein
MLDVNRPREPELPAERGSASLLADIRQYLLARPPHETAVRLANWTLRPFYQQRIMQRLGVSVADYAILNIHRIGVEAPAVSVWEVIETWNAGSGFWPDRLATLEQRTEHLDQVRVSPLGLHRIDLFRLTLLRRQDVPPPEGVDNARYLLYRCSGGYPIGIFFIYVRSRIPEEGEVEQTQVFLVVAFNFYGHDRLSRLACVRAPWQWVHDRVTANVLTRLKARCEVDVGRVAAVGSS